LPSFLGLPGLALAIGLALLRFVLLELPALGLVILTRVGRRNRAAPDDNLKRSQ
jgi:hypothetical protein